MWALISPSKQKKVNRSKYKWEVSFVSIGECPFESG